MGLRRLRGCLMRDAEVACMNILYSCNLDTLSKSTYVYNYAYLQQTKSCPRIGSMSCNCLNAALCNNECYTSLGLFYVSTLSGIFCLLSHSIDLLPPPQIPIMRQPINMQPIRRRHLRQPGPHNGMPHINRTADLMMHLKIPGYKRKS